MAADARSALRAVGRRRLADVAAKGLGELGRLAVTDARGDLADGYAVAGEQLRRAVHPHPRKVLPERRVADLGEDPLDLPPGRGHAARDLVELQVGRVLVGDDPRRLVVQAPAQGYRGGALPGHVGERYAGGARMDRYAPRWRIPAPSGVLMPAEPLDRIALIVANGRFRRAAIWKYATE